MRDWMGTLLDEGGAVTTFAPAVAGGLQPAIRQPELANIVVDNQTAKRYPSAGGSRRPRSSANVVWRYRRARLRIALNDRQTQPTGVGTYRESPPSGVRQTLPFSDASPNPGKRLLISAEKKDPR